MWYEIFFTPKMYQLNKKLLNCQMSAVTIFQLNTLAKAPAVDLLRLNTLRGTKTAFLTLKRYDEYPLLFIWDESKTFVRVDSSCINCKTTSADVSYFFCCMR